MIDRKVANVALIKLNQGLLVLVEDERPAGVKGGGHPVSALAAGSEAPPRSRALSAGTSIMSDLGQLGAYRWPLARAVMSERSLKSA